MDRETVFFPRVGDWEQWLEANHLRPTGVWVRLLKKGREPDSLTYAQALDVALCFGWIDGQKAKLDEESWLQYFTRRKKASLWSQVNREHVARLEAEGRMRDPGRQAIAEAKRSGQWEAAYQPTRSREVPPELEAAFRDHPSAKSFFETLNSQNRFASVFRIQSAKKSETKERRVKEFIQMMEEGRVFYP
jgi:uncharacterized protein YdeI (YjbR/CyaY-like superfamily)